MHQKKPLLFVLFVLLAGLSFYHVDKSILVVKYLFQYNIQFLLQDYFKYHHSLKEFLHQTCIFHQGNSEAGWKTAFFLWPLFLFCDAHGGLTLTNICLFTVISSLLTIPLFYWWVKKHWGQQSAFWGTFFFGFSAIFQEFARSGSYDAYSILIAMIWTILFFHCAQKASVLSYGVLGIFTGFSWYGYSMLRTFIVPVFIEIFCFAKHRWWAVTLFIAGMLLWIVPGIVILLNLLHAYNYHGPLDLLLVDKENIFRSVDGSVLRGLETVIYNLAAFFKRMLGVNDVLDFPSKNQPHAHYLQHLLVIPLFFGVRRVWSLRKETPNRLLLLLSMIIYLTPLGTSWWANTEGRRFLFYVLPTYCFIGIGMQEIFSRVYAIKDKDFKSAAMVFLLLGVCYVVGSEAFFEQRFILGGQRDLGLVDFADKLNQRPGHATIVYLEKRQKSLYSFNNEGYLLYLLLGKNGQHSYEIRESLFDTPLQTVYGRFYVVKSPMISPKEFQRWCQSNQLECGAPVLTSVIKNQPLNAVSLKPSGIKEPFELFGLMQQNNHRSPLRNKTISPLG